MPRHINIKPYQARAKLRSINYWQKVVNGELPAKRPLAYYKNHLAFYNEIDIEHLETQAKIRLQ